jgi:hypothetical protein
MGFAILLGAALPIAARLEQRGIGKGGALAGGLLGGLLILAVIAVVVAGFLYILNLRTRLRSGDKVRVSMGVHKGAVGVLREPATGGHAARVELQGRSEAVIFHGWEIEKLK